MSGSVEIKRSPEDVIRYVAEPSRRRERQDAVERIEDVRSTAEGVGTRVRKTRRIQGTCGPSPGRSPTVILGAAVRCMESTVQCVLGSS
jgi:hypothetical protein